MESDKQVLNNQKIILILLVLSVLIGSAALYRLAGYSSPTGRFTTDEQRVTSCKFEGIILLGRGVSQADAAADLLARQDSISYLFCNGRFRGEAPSTAIPSLGCLSCKPNCEPTVVDADTPAVSPVEDGYGMLKTVNIYCRR